MGHAGDQLSFWSLACGFMLGRGCLSDQLLPEASGPDCGAVFVIDILHTLSNLMPKELSVACVTSRGRTPGSLHLASFGVPPRLPFPSADSAREALANLNLSQEYV